MTSGEQRVTVQEAASRLGVKEDAIRKRIQRGTLRHEKDPNDGRVYVYVNGTQDATQDISEDASYDVLVEALNDQVEYLRRVIDTRDRELEARTEELRRKDHIIAALTDRIPELEPARETPPDTRNGYETDSEEGNDTHVPRDGRGQEKTVPWWRRLFGV
jgi:excisionase family DNA binding protein